MLFTYITDRVSYATIGKVCERMEEKYGRAGYEDMANNGFFIPFSKYRRVFCKELTNEMISRLKQ